MSNALTPLAFSLDPEDPATLTYPPTLPVEIALKTAPLPTICASYGISKAQWDVLRKHPVFIHDLTQAVEMLKREGMSFRMKARLQAEELLKTSWSLIHKPSDEVPPSVKADLIKFTIKAAGLDASADKATGNAPPLQININL